MYIYLSLNLSSLPSRAHLNDDTIELCAHNSNGLCDIILKAVMPIADCMMWHVGIGVNSWNPVSEMYLSNEKVIIV